MEIADKMGDAALGVTKLGVVVGGVGIATAQPELATLGGAAISTGGALGAGSGILQIVGGIAQGQSLDIN